jgi:hypothetical protein
MLSRLDLNGLLCVNMIPGDEKIGIVLKFSHVHKERKYREYLFDDEGQCEVCSGLKFFNIKSITYIYFVLLFERRIVFFTLGLSQYFLFQIW